MLSYKELQEQKKKELKEHTQATQFDHTMMGAFIMKLFDARTSTHVQHLQTTSYAKHIALSAFYAGIIDLADGIVESWQGIYGEILSYPPPAPLQVDSMTTLTNLRDWITINRYSISDESEIQNDIDTVLSLINSTIYKLKFLN